MEIDNIESLKKNKKNNFISRLISASPWIAIITISSIITGIMIYKTIELLITN